MKEHISRLLDGELDADERDLALRALQDDHGLRAVWERYHVARAALRRQPQRIVREGLCAGLLDSPVLNPQPPASQLPAHPVVDRARDRTPVWFRPAFGLAMAATVAAVAILSLRPAGTGLPGGGLPGGATPGSEITASERTASVPATVSAQAPATPGTLSGYLVEHSEHAARQGMPEMLSYVRMVSETRMEQARTGTAE